MRQLLVQQNLYEVWFMDCRFLGHGWKFTGSDLAATVQLLQDFSDSQSHSPLLANVRNFSRVISVSKSLGNQYEMLLVKTLVVRPSLRLFVHT